MVIKGKNSKLRKLGKLLAKGKGTAPKMSNKVNPTFGPVATINTAPVAIGNSMQGFSSQVIHTSNGVRVIGRDYAFTPVATGSIQGWALTGGMPLTPCCMPSTILRNFVQMYNKFKWNNCRFHYITSSSTNTTGDVTFYYSKNASSQFPDWTNNSFLPFVLSDSNTVIGPQWTNHTVLCSPKTTWLSTDYGADSLNESAYSAGDIFLFSKTASTESPGYVIFDYDISFNTLSVNPRSGTLPTIKAQWTPAALVNSTVAVADTTNMVLTSGPSGLGGTTISAFQPVAGDIYEFIIDVLNSTYGAGSLGSTAWSYKPISTVVAINAFTGMKFYLKADGVNSFRLYCSLSEAMNDSKEILCHQTITYADTYRGYCKYITSDNPATFQQAY